MRIVPILVLSLCIAGMSYGQVTNGGFGTNAPCDLTGWTDCSFGSRGDVDPPCEAGSISVAQCYAGQSNGNPGTTPRGIYQSIGAVNGDMDWSVDMAGGDIPAPTEALSLRYYTADPTCTNVCTQGTVLAYDDNSCGGGFTTFSGTTPLNAAEVFVGLAFCGGVDWNAAHFYADNVSVTITGGSSSTSVSDWALYN